MLIQLLLRRILVMALLTLLGLYLFQRNILTQRGGTDLSAILVRLIVPCVILRSFLTVDPSPETRRLILVSTLCALCALLLSMLVSALAFGRRRPVHHFSAAFSNAGFMGIPLVEAVLGSGAVLLIAPFIALLNLFQWTYGLFVLTGEKRHLSARAIARNPVLLSFAGGLLVFFLQIPVPDVLTDAIGAVAQMNTPVAMICLGMLMRRVNWASLWRDGPAWACAILRLLVIPGLTAVLLRLLPWAEETVCVAVLIAASAPVGSNVAVFAQLYGKETDDAVKAVTLSTLLCAFSMPLILTLNAYLL